jgi:hypothetical protein
MFVKIGGEVMGRFLFFTFLIELNLPYEVKFFCTFYISYFFENEFFIKIKTT